MIVTPHLQAYYRFENNGLDSSGKGNHLTAVGATYGAGKVGNDAIYDGVDDYHNGGNILNLGTSDRFISFWVKPASLSGIFGFITKSNDDINTRFHINTYLGTTYFTIKNIYIGIPITELTANQWTHISWNINRSGNMVVKYNNIVKGIADVSSLAGQNIISTTPFRIGAFTQVDNITPTHFFNGQIDEVLIYDKTMSLMDQKRIYCGLHPLNG